MLTLTLSPATRGTIHYTLDGKAPTSSSPVYTEPIHITATTDFKAQALDVEGKPLGYPRWTKYEWYSIAGNPGHVEEK